MLSVAKTLYMTRQDYQWSFNRLMQMEQLLRQLLNLQSEVLMLQGGLI